MVNTENIQNKYLIFFKFLKEIFFSGTYFFFYFIFKTYNVIDNKVFLQLFATVEPKNNFCFTYFILTILNVFILLFLDLLGEYSLISLLICSLLIYRLFDFAFCILIRSYVIIYSPNGNDSIPSWIPNYGKNSLILHSMFEHMD